ncbi:MAG: response regulator transcription factor [Phycisphaeraceae bacterium JB051]
MSDSLQPNQIQSNCLMVLEADEVQTHSLVQLLTAYGYDCVALTSVKELKHDDLDDTVAYCLLADVGTSNSNTADLDDYIQKNPQVPTIAMSCSSNVNMAVRYTRMGTVGFLSKPLQIDSLLVAVEDGLKLARQIMDYRLQRIEYENRLKRLSQREREVLNLVIDGMSSSQIAEHLGLSVKTVSLHRTNLMNKLDADGVVHLVRMITPGPMPKPISPWQRHH